MDYYEELGIPRSASQEDIRTAWKRLAFLLHPDRQPDEQSRTIAELQMRRANEIIAVLGDPARRRAYDLDLAGTLPHRPVAIPVTSGRFFGRVDPRVWSAAALLLIVLTVGALAWVSLDRPPERFEVKTNAPPTAQHDVSSPPNLPEAAENRVSQPVVAPTLSEVPEVEHPARAAASHAKKPRTQQGNSGHSIRPVPQLAPPEILASNPVPIAEPPLPLLLSAKPPVPPAARPATLEGTWIYVKPAASKRTPAHVYPPEYIQLSIHEDNGGELSGNYIARYNARDLPVSQNVEFEFHGSAPAGSVFQWSGNEGAQGTIELKIVDANALQVHWSTTRAGRVSSLLAGTAVLIRADGS